MDGGSDSVNKLPLLQAATALAMSFAICKTGKYTTIFFAVPGDILPIVTAIVVIQTQLNHLAPSGEAFAVILMQVSFAVFGASGNIWNVINTASSIFKFAPVQIAIHLAVILGLGKLFCFLPKTVANCIKC